MKTKSQIISLTYLETGYMENFPVHFGILHVTTGNTYATFRASQIPGSLPASPPVSIQPNRVEFSSCRGNRVTALALRGLDVRRRQGVAVFLITGPFPTGMERRMDDKKEASTRNGRTLRNSLSRSNEEGPPPTVG
ncbi:hypothetical protein GWI33_008846 [Rhynchophorus ferrugineus]|uniref:Uncharacterized protein n=1 Tax=Rhynchophorus ferrugineus TaxID=354439 RepID=A0A834IHI4_RHYFE|nr:hypothetical protein GWI33_008846 [Rhynchophorus ferrugineus]